MEEKILNMILAPPDDSKFLWNPDSAKWGFGPNPVVARLQQRGELISLFGPEDQQIILDVLNQLPTAYPDGHVKPLFVSPINKLPPELSKHIMMPGSG